MALTRIVSGGQTGVDRGALDAALESGFQCGGWCPEGRQAEDNPIPARYPLTEIAGGGYAERTLKNVLASDASAILYFRKIEGGTQQTMVHCIEHGKPHETIDAGSTSPEEGAARLAAFIAANNVAVLNVAGPRASKWPGARDYAYELVKHLLQTREKQGNN